MTALDWLERQEGDGKNRLSTPLFTAAHPLVGSWYVPMGVVISAHMG